MSSQPRMTIGFQTPTGRPWPELAADWQMLEAAGFDSLWLVDHLNNAPSLPGLPLLESWTALASMAAVTRSARIGVLVSSNTFRNPAVLAKQAMTVDQISGGRLEFALGAGGFAPEHQQYGIPYGAPRELVERFREAVELCLTLLRGDGVAPLSYAGRYYQLDNALFRPAPIQPRMPLTLGGSGPRMLDIAARYADRWNSNKSLPEMIELSARLDDACLKVGRDPAEIRRSHLYVPIFVPEERPWDSTEAFLDFAGRYGEAGITDLILQPTTGLSRETIERIAHDALPRLHREAADQGKPRA